MPAGRGQPSRYHRQCPAARSPAAPRPDARVAGRPGPLELHARAVHRYAMEERDWIMRHGFWPLALLWLPFGIAVQAVVRFPPGAGSPSDGHLWPAVLTAAGSLGLGRRDRPGRRHRRRIAGGGPARAGCGRRLRDRPQPARVGDMVVAGAERLTAVGAGPRPRARASRKSGCSPDRVCAPRPSSAPPRRASSPAESPTGRFGVRAFRDRAGIGRNLAIDLLEHFDAVKLTRRIGDGREIVRPLAEVFGPGQDGADGTAQGKESHPGGAPGLQIR